MLSYSEELSLEPILINLIPEKEIAKQNRGQRELTEGEYNRIEYMYETENIRNPVMGFSVDNTHQNINETIEEIFKYIEQTAIAYL